MTLKPVPIPPHFRYFCVSCEQDFSTTERAPHAVPRGDPMQPFYCARCAAVELGRS